MTADEIIKLLNLQPLPEEGGFFRETYRDPLTISGQALPGHDGDRQASTCIYYLVTPEEFSGLHAVLSTEVFHFYAGDPVEMIQIHEDGQLHSITIGPNLSQGEVPQVVVPPKVWQGTKLKGRGQWALLGCTVAPGFDYKDFIGGSFQELSERFSQHSEVIRRYTHQ